MINRVIDGFKNIKTSIHICRGNWSRDESNLLSGDYGKLLPMLQKMNVDQYVLEFATPRAGDINIVGEALSDKQIGLGVINPRTETIETTDFIINKVETALQYFKPKDIFLNPDCGFGCFANKCVNDEKTAVSKLNQMVKAAAILREKYA